MLGVMLPARRTETAFTLIELLVVMVIVAILMAVAVPTFLSQKSSARRTQVLSNFKMIQDALETCAASRNGSDGTYGGCTEHTQLQAYEKGIAQLEICCPSGSVVLNTYDINGIAGGVRRLTPVDTDNVEGYELIAWVKDGDKAIWFQLLHWSDGGITKRCGEGKVLPPFTATPGTAVAGSRMCRDGSW
jgi:prepilin-type N-terminal cleavage/methylation domain-containing protein